MRRPAPLRAIDPTALAQIARGPGLDTNTWALLLRVQEVVWDPESGGIVSGIVEGGPLAGTTDFVASVTQGLAGSGVMSSAPVPVGALGLVIMPGGDPNEDPQLVAWTIGPDSTPPTAVAGQQVADVFGTSLLLGAAGFDVNAEMVELRVVADKIRLVLADPEQPFVRGKAFVDALSAWLDATSKFVDVTYPLVTAADAACVGPLAALKPFFTGWGPALQTWKADIATFKAHLIDGDALSTKIIGD